MKTKTNKEGNDFQILIVEDSPTQAEKLKYILKKNNYSVIVAQDGTIALDMAITSKPSLIISDIVMPKMNGYELCKEIKNNDSLSDIPIILLTSLSSTEDVLEGLACGADNFLTKPYSEVYLLSLIDHIVANREIRKTELVTIGIEISLGGKKRFITANQQQMLSLLLSTYDAAVHKNNELVQTQDELKSINEHLEELVEERTADLSKENNVRLHAEKQVNKLNRVYALLSNTNQAIVRIHETEVLLNDICLIAVDEGKFISSCIGIVNQETNKLEMVASAGVANNLNSISIENNPIHEAVRTGKHILSNSISTDATLTEIWKAEADKLGFNSFATFPIIISEQVIGCFCIYSGEVNFFDEVETNLLDEMATDISYALENIKKEEKRKQAEKALKQSEAKYRELIENLNDVIFSVDISGKIGFISPAIIRLTGYTPREVVGKNISDFFNNDFLNQFINQVNQTAGDENTVDEFLIKAKDKSTKCVRVSYRSILENNKIVGIRGILSDITERKQAEIDLRSSEEKFRKLIESAPLPLCYVNNCGVITFRNDRFLKIFGYDEIEVPNIDEWWLKAYPNEDYRKWVIQNWDSAVKHAAETGTDIESEEYHVTCKDGAVREIIISGITINDNLLATFIDITDRKQAEEALKKNEERWRLAIASSPVPIMIHDEDDNIIQLSAGWTKFSGYTIDDIPTMADWTERAYGERTGSKKEYIDQLFKIEETVNNGVWIIKAKDGSNRIWDFQTTPIGKTLEGKRVLHSMAIDITEQKLAELELGKREKLLQKIFELIPIGLWIADKNGKLISGNPAGIKIWGAEPHVGIEQYGVFKAKRLPSRKEIAPNDWALAHTINEGVTITDEMLEIEAFDGRKKIIINYTSPLLDDNGNIDGAIVVNYDISALKQAEEELKENNIFLQTLLNTIPAPVFYKDNNGVYTGVNSSFETFFGKSSSEIVGKTVFDINPPELADIYHKYDLELLSSKRLQVYETQMKDSKGQLHDVIFSKAVLADTKDIVNGIVGVILDITDLRDTEKQLSEKTLIFNSLMENSPIHVFFKDENSRPIYLSKNYEHMLGMPLSEIVGKSMFELFPSEVAQSMVNDDKKVLESGAMVEVEESLNEKHFTTIKFPITRDDGTKLLAGFTIDITDRKNAEEALIELKDSLEVSVKEKTKELQEQVAELERFHDATIDRELRMKELRDEIERLKGEKPLNI